MPTTESLMIAAAMCSVLVALLHVYVIVQGPWAYRFFGAGERLASLAEQGSWVPSTLTWGITLVFLVFATYYFAGAGLLPPPPLYRWALIGIAALYLLRGMVLVPCLLFGVRLSAFDFWSSLVSLAIGLLHGAAVWRLFGSASVALPWPL